MGKAIFINDNGGTIINVSKNKTKIKILLTKGGIVIARNEGFDKGDKVCFILNAMRTKIIKVIPQLIANVTVAVGSNPTLRSSMDEQPDNIEDDFDEYRFTQFLPPMIRLYQIHTPHQRSNTPLLC